MFNSYKHDSTDTIYIFAHVYSKCVYEFRVNVHDDYANTLKYVVCCFVVSSASVSARGDTVHSEILRFIRY